MGGRGHVAVTLPFETCGVGDGYACPGPVFSSSGVAYAGPAPAVYLTGRRGAKCLLAVLGQTITKPIYDTGPGFCPVRLVF